jgi:hypothetical protein
MWRGFRRCILPIQAGFLATKAEPMTNRTTRPALLDQQMKSLRLSPASIEKGNPAVMQNLQHSCSSCGLKSQCARDLASEHRASVVAEYCPNEQTLKVLRST